MYIFGPIAKSYCTGYIKTLIPNHLSLTMSKKLLNHFQMKYGHIHPGISTQRLLSSQLWSQGPQWLAYKSEWLNWLPTSVLHLQLADSEDTDTTEVHLCATDNNNITDIHNTVDISHYMDIPDDDINKSMFGRQQERKFGQVVYRCILPPHLRSLSLSKNN